MGQEGCVWCRRGRCRRGAATAKDLGVVDLCGVEEVWEVGAGQTGVAISYDLPPGLLDLYTFDPWGKHLDPESWCNHWDEQFRKHTREALRPRMTHRHKAPPIPDAGPARNQHARGMRELHEQMGRFVRLAEHVTGKPSRVSGVLKRWRRRATPRAQQTCRQTPNPRGTRGSS